jgi:hypothetical protein
LSSDVICGLVETKDIPMILLKKIKIILLGVAAQSAEELEDLKKEHQRGNMSKQQYKDWEMLEVNLSYLVEMIEPMVLKLKIFEDFQKPLQVSAIMKAYRQTAEELRPLENYAVSCYNAEPQLCKLGVEWNEAAEKYIKVD